jgi:hypothetical protein
MLLTNKNPRSICYRRHEDETSQGGDTKESKVGVNTKMPPSVWPFMAPWSDGLGVALACQRHLPQAVANAQMWWLSCPGKTLEGFKTSR